MSKVLAASGADAWIERDLGSNHAEVWTTLEIRLDAATLAAWAISSPNIFSYYDAPHTNLNENLFVNAGPIWQTGWGPGGGAPVADAYMLMELGWINSGPTALYMNGVLIESATDFSALDTRFVRLPIDGGSAPSPVYVRNVKIGTSRGASDLLADDFSSGGLSAWTSTNGDVSVIDDPAPPLFAVAVGLPTGPPPPPLADFGVLWRFVVTDRECGVVTLLDRLAKNRSVIPILDAPWTSSGEVPSDSPEVNILFDPDQEPFLSYGNRFLFGFRREAPVGGDPWVCRFSGRLQLVEDRAASDQSMTPYTAYDPWQYAMSRPVLTDAGELPGPDGVTYTDQRASFMALDLLQRSAVRASADGLSDAEANCNIDWGQSGFWEGVLEDTDVIGGDTNFPQGMSVGEAWAQLCEGGTIDIGLRPIFDPVNRPGLISEFSTYVVQGGNNFGAIFAWDRPSRSLVELSRLHDFTAAATLVQAYAGQGGAAVTLQQDAAALAKYGEWWLQQFYPDWKISPIFVEGLAAAQLALRKAGKTTVTFSPAPERSPQPFRDYHLGDRCPVYASGERFREILAPDLIADPPTGLARIHSFPIQISDDALERVVGVLTAAADATA